VSRRGFTLLEVVVALAVFGVFLMILTTLSLEMRTNEKRYPVNFMEHPQVMTVLARMRRDVLDAFGADPYPTSSPDGKYTQSNKTLIVDTMVSGGLQRVVWDFTRPGEVHRISYNVGVKTEWVARGLPPDFEANIDAVELASHPYGVRITAADSKGRLSVDQYLQPRVHE
jgi:prepilin-type N-terminal cleavage/methylation domain-containing protein